MRLLVSLLVLLLFLLERRAAAALVSSPPAAVRSRRVVAPSSSSSSVRLAASMMSSSVMERSGASLRSKLSQAVHGAALDEMVRRRWLSSAQHELNVVEDAVVWSARDVSWFGGGGSHDDGKQQHPKLRVSSIDAQVLSLPQRLMSRGRRGSFRATVSASATDVDSSTWCHAGLALILRRVLDFVGADLPAEPVTFETTFLEEEGRVRLDATAATFGTASCSFVPAVERGTIVLAKPTLTLSSSERQLGSKKNARLKLPLPLAENLGALYLSAFALDLHPALHVVDLKVLNDSGGGSEEQQQQQRKKKNTKLAVTVVNSREGLSSSGPSSQGADDSADVFEWRFSHHFAGAPGFAFRHTFRLGPRLPWLLNHRRRAPRAALFSMTLLSAALSAATLPEAAAARLDDFREALVARLDRLGAAVVGSIRGVAAGLTERARSWFFASVVRLTTRRRSPRSRRHGLASPFVNNNNKKHARAGTTPLHHHHHHHHKAPAAQTYGRALVNKFPPSPARKKIRNRAATNHADRRRPREHHHRGGGALGARHGGRLVPQGHAAAAAPDHRPALPFAPAALAPWKRAPFSSSSSSSSSSST